MRMIFPVTGVCAVLGAVALSACGQVATGPPGPPGDQTPATFAVDTVYIGATLSTIPVALNASMVKAWVADSEARGGFRELNVTFVGTSAQCDLPVGSDGLWQLVMPARFGAAPRVFPITDNTRQWHTVITTPGNPNAAAPPAAALIDARTTLTQNSDAFDNFNLSVAGAWSGLRFLDQRDGSTTYDPVPRLYSSSTTPAGIPLYTITRNDRVYITRYRLPNLASVAKIAPFDLGPGTTAVTGAQVDVPKNRSLNATLNSADVLNRLQPQIAAGATLYENYWRIVASPTGPYPYSGGLLLTAGSAAPTLQVNYGNPFADDGLSAMFFWGTTTSRYERDSDGTIWIHNAGFMLEDTTPLGNRSYVADSGLPASISLNGVVLSSDKVGVAVSPGKSLELSFEADRMDSEWRSMECYRFDINPPRETLVLTARLLSNRINLPDSMLPRGSRYKCRMYLMRGAPNALLGDDREREPTIRFAYLDSSSFNIR